MPELTPVEVSAEEKGVAASFMLRMLNQDKPFSASLYNLHYIGMIVREPLDHPNNLRATEAWLQASDPVHLHWASLMMDPDPEDPVWVDFFRLAATLKGIERGTPYGFKAETEEFFDISFQLAYHSMMRLLVRMGYIGIETPELKLDDDKYTYRKLKDFDVDKLSFEVEEWVREHSKVAQAGEIDPLEEGEE
jgi:hypothetical protein